MDGNSKINALNVVGTRTIQDSRIIAKVIVFLDDSNPAVQQAAISSLTRMGDHALIQATPALNRVVLRPGEPEPVRQSAVQALNAIRR